MRTIALFVAAAAVLLAAGCATQKREATKVGQVGINTAEERAIVDSLETSKFYEYNTPKTGVVLRSNPPGALVEWLNNDGLWVSVGTTPTLQIAIEATGRPELFRVSMGGYLPEIRWVAATPASQSVTVEFNLERELKQDRFVLGMNK